MNALVTAEIGTGQAESQAKNDSARASRFELLVPVLGYEFGAS